MNGLAVANCERLPLADESVDMIFTDPPYHTKYLYLYSWLASEATRVLKPGGFVLSYSGSLHLNKVIRAFDDAGLTFFWALVENLPGNKGTFVQERKVLTLQKPIIAYTKGKGRLRVGGMQSRFDSVGKMKAYHHWGQDVGTARYYIDHCTKMGDIVLDPFVGGGTTVVACELIGRRCIGFDITLAAVLQSQRRLGGEMLMHQGSLFGRGE